MAYGLDPRAPIADGYPDHGRERLPAERWQRLSEAYRLALVERALAPRPTLPDGLPAAL